MSASLVGDRKRNDNCEKCADLQRSLLLVVAVGQIYQER